jgi:ribose transport system ATP-binding protein
VVTETVLQFTGLSKTFGATRALIDVDFDVQAGEVHGLVGRNGSGKSTLIKVLSGYHVPDSGSHLTLDGQEIHLPISGREAAAHGLVFVHQDLGLVPAYSVLENIRLNSWQAHGLQKINWKAERAGVEDELERFGIQVNAETPVAALSQVDRAIVAIVRAMHHLGSDGTDGKGKVLVLDEPTAYLPTDSVERLFEAVRTVAATGAGVVFVSHRTDEVLSLTDRITVLRDGRLVDTVTTSETDEDSLVSLILGQALSSFYPDPVQTAPGERVLDVTELNGDLVRDFDLTVDRGEIVGITGLMGAGHDEVPYYIFGARDAKSGHIVVNGQTLKTHKATPTEAIAAGVALLPADRLNLSGSSAASVEDNVALPVFRRYFSRGRLQLAQVRERVGGLLTTFDVRPAMPNLEFSALSGGNQQKALLAKWLQMEPTLLLLHEPTQGVDVGSKADIFSRITEAAEAGTAIIIASAEHEDLANLCTRVIVFDSGRVVGELSGAELTEERILDLCYRGARGRGAHGMVFQWRPYRVGFVAEGTEPEFIVEAEVTPTRRVFQWRPYRVGFVAEGTEPEFLVAAVPPPAQRIFRWHPHRVGYVDAA